MIIIKNLKDEKPKEVYDIKVDRTSILGNPFYMIHETQRDAVCDKYEKYFKQNIKGRFKEELKRLKDIYKEYGKLNFFCWCSPKRCHAETIKKWLEQNI